MTPEELNISLLPLYKSYNTVIKPLIAEIETVERKQPYILFNEIRALHDHISKCFLTDFSDEDILKEIKKAEGHLNRLILDCYKFLGVYYYLVYKKFTKKYRNVDLRVISNGTFISDLRPLIYNADQTLKKAKRLQTINIEESIKLFEQSLNGYRDAEELIAKHSPDLLWSKAKYSGKKIAAVPLYIIGSLFLGIIANVICQFYGYNLFAEILAYFK